jgi:hypothetical protein
MSLLFIESFDVYGTGGYGLNLLGKAWGDIDSIWNDYDKELYSSTINRNDEYSPSYSLKLQSAGTRVFLDFDNLAGGGYSGTVGFAVYYAGNAKHENVDDSLYPLVDFWQRTAFGDLSESSCLTRSIAGTMVLFNYDDEIICSGTTALDNDKWYYIEVIYHNSQGASNAPNGACKVYIDGELDSQSATNAKTGSSDGILRGLSFNSVDGNDETIPVYVDDFYLTINAGSSNTGVLGPVTVRGLLPNANGSLSQLTGDDGNSTNNYQNVDDAPADETTYNSGEIPERSDLYNFSNLGAEVAEVYGVQLDNYAKKNLDGARAYVPLTKADGASIREQTSKLLTTSYKYGFEVFNEDPETSSQWSITDINDYQFGVRIK